MIVTSTGGGEMNAIVTRRAIINSVSNGNGRRRTVDYCRSSEIILEGFVFFSPCSPHSPVKLFCSHSHCQPLSSEGKHYSVMRSLKIMLFPMIQLVSRVCWYIKCEFISLVFAHAVCFITHTIPKCSYFRVM